MSRDVDKPSHCERDKKAVIKITPEMIDVAADVLEMSYGWDLVRGSTEALAEKMLRCALEEL